MNKPDVSDELGFVRFGNGIKLLPPTKNTNYAVKNIMEFQCNVGFSNTDICIQRINEQTAATLGFESTTTARGKQISSVININSAQKVLENNLKTIKTNKITLVEEEIIRKDEISLNRLSIYTPWYDYQDKITGVFGCSIILGLQPLAESLMHLKELGLFSGAALPIFSYENDHGIVYFTKRERDCIHHIVRGKTIKETANILNLSKRTVEYYFEQIKVKTNVCTKSEFLAKIWDMPGVLM